VDSGVFWSRILAHLISINPIFKLSVGDCPKLTFNTNTAKNVVTKIFIGELVR
jgi:hypothetical protein